MLKEVIETLKKEMKICSWKEWIDEQQNITKEDLINELKFCIKYTEDANLIDFYNSLINKINK